jgi:RNA polymerase sigma-70 factor, ECF subfamily
MNISRRRGSTGPDDRQLVRDLQRQRPSAVELVSSRYGGLLRGYLRELLDDAAAVEDVLQLTLIDAWRRGASYDPERAAVSTWLLMIARSRAIDHLRRRVPEPFDPETMPEVIDRSTTDQADALLEQWRVAALIARLPKDEATMLRMRFYEGYSQREIAERTGVALGTVKMRMVKALDRLREAIQQEDVIP